MQVPIQSIVRFCKLDPSTGLKLARKDASTWCCVVPKNWSGSFILSAPCKGYVNANFNGSNFHLDGAQKKVPCVAEGQCWEFTSDRSISVILVLYSKQDPKIESMKRRPTAIAEPPSTLLTSFYTSKPITDESEFGDVRVTTETIPLVAHHLADKHDHLDYTQVLFWLQDLVQTETRTLTVSYADGLLHDQVKHSPPAPTVVEPDEPAPAPALVETQEARRKKFADKFDTLFAKKTQQ